ncbi:MFS transporter [Pseudonocardia kunmingensis]|uniref:Putative MFS family arabinose efflux permease n=1 Tax=Pseudonocardia kunmingensis TaxID=630975 RepID=A0A543E1P7_9PSEU|nr:MFS transporter [Pseudonocardia kunmingensis]TQM15508.1 putative MFS family arabinose efflux permease [Pseudonocardia kunmingensis]
MRTGLLDTRPLRTSPAFRRLWIGTVAIRCSGQMAVVAVLYQVWELTRSPLWTGAIGVATAVPNIVLGLLGGTIADTFDRRRVVLLTSSGAVAAATLLAAQAVAGLGSAPLVLVLVAAQTSCTALGAASRRAIMPRLLPQSQVAAGVALDLAAFQVAMLVGPAVAGVVLAGWGPSWVYTVDALAILIALYGVVRLPPMRPEGGSTRAGPRATGEGLAFLWRRPALRGVLAADLAATVLAMPVALFPVINQERFGGDPHTLGLFLTAVAVGGMTAGLLSGLVTSAVRPGAVMLGAAAVWGVALAGFGLVDGLVATLTCLAVAGAADTVSVTSGGTLVQLETPDGFRGRINSAQYAVGAGGPGIGDARAGLVAGLVSASAAAVSGGVACVLAVMVIAGTHPALRRWRHPDPVDDRA